MEYLKALNPSVLCCLLNREGSIKNNHQTRVKKDLLKQIEKLSKKLSKLGIEITLTMKKHEILNVSLTSENWPKLKNIMSWYGSLSEKQIIGLDTELGLKLEQIEEHILDCCEDCKSGNIETLTVPPECEHESFICHNCGNEWTEE